LERLARDRCSTLVGFGLTVKTKNKIFDSNSANGREHLNVIIK
jgi:hypothetical protein